MPLAGFRRGLARQGVGELDPVDVRVPEHVRLRTAVDGTASGNDAITTANSKRMRLP